MAARKQPEVSTFSGHAQSLSVGAAGLRSSGRVAESRELSSEVEPAGAERVQAYCYRLQRPIAQNGAHSRALKRRSTRVNGVRALGKARLRPARGWLTAAGARASFHGGLTQLIPHPCTTPRHASLDSHILDGTDSPTYAHAHSRTQTNESTNPDQKKKLNGNYVCTNTPSAGIAPRERRAQLSPNASRLDRLFGSNYGRSPNETALSPFLVDSSSSVTLWKDEVFARWRGRWLPLEPNLEVVVVTHNPE